MGDFPGHSGLAGCWADLAVGGVSYVEMLLLKKVWAGERDLSWRKLFHGIVDQVAQFRCRLFLLVQPLIFGALASSQVAL